MLPVPALNVKDPDIEAAPATSRLVEERELKAPVFGVVRPIVPGAVQVSPAKLEALMVPVGLYVNDAPVPTTIAAEMFVPEINLSKETVVPEGREVVQPKVPVPLVCKNPDAV